MQPTPLSQIAAWTRGTLAASDPAVLAGPDVVTDSRQIRPGALFVALPGERVDGHDYVAQAARDGAAAAVVAHRVAVDLPQIVVDDTALALAAIAQGVVRREKERGLLVVGVTGSSGKTSTKDLIAQVLADAGETVAPVGSFNNEIGVPLTACRVDASTAFLVAEMGARGLGHVSWLCDLVQPSVGVVLNVGHAHLGEFGSQAVIAQAKGELVEAVDGWAVLNADDALVAAMAPRTTARVAAFSASAEPALGELRVWASDVASDDLQRYRFTLHAAGAVAGEAAVRLRVMGEHNVSNALAAAAVALAVGLDLAAVARSLTAATARSKWRMQLDTREDGLAVLNDSYNANPDSMAAAIASLARLRRPSGRLIAVLGDMLELGEESAAEHAEVGRLAALAGIDELYAVGDFGPDLARGFSAAGGAVARVVPKDSVSETLAGRLSGSDVVLVKASRGLALETVADALLKEGSDR